MTFKILSRKGDQVTTVYEEVGPDHAVWMYCGVSVAKTALEVGQRCAAVTARSDGWTYEVERLS